MSGHRPFLWGTREELEFLDGLGTYSYIGQKLGAEEMMRRYAMAICKRGDWHAINDVVIAQAVSARVMA